MAIIVIVTRPEDRRSAVYHEVSFSWVNLADLRLVVRTDLYRLVWLAVRSHARTVTSAAAWLSSVWSYRRTIRWLYVTVRTAVDRTIARTVARAIARACHADWLVAILRLETTVVRWLCSGRRLGLS